MPCEFCTRLIKGHIILETWQDYVCDARACLVDIMARNLRAGGAYVEKPIKVDLFSGRIEESFISKDSTQEKLEFMYLSIFFCLDISSLVSLMCRNRLDCLGYKYVPPSIVKGFITRSTNKLYFLPVIYFSATSPLFFSFRRVLSS